MNYYLITVEIIGGLLTPIFLIVLLVLLIQAVNLFREAIKYKREELAKLRVFDTSAEFYKVPNPTMIGVRLKRGETVVWEGGIDKPERREV